MASSYWEHARKLLTSPPLKGQQLWTNTVGYPSEVVKLDHFETAPRSAKWNTIPRL